MASNNNQSINPRPCVYNCGIQIYWNASENTYFEVFTKQKHQCPNRSNNKKSITPKLSSGITSKSNYYNKFAKQPKPKMSNSLELLTGSIDAIQKKYEILSDVVSEYNGKVHGSQSHTVTANNNSILLIVYYEVPEGQRDEVKHKFGEYIRTNLVALQRNG